MRKLFSKRRHCSGRLAKDRLRTLLEKDRSAVYGSRVLEKIKREVSAVLLKYTDENSSPEVQVTYSHDSQCVLAARILVKEKYYR